MSAHRRGWKIVLLRIVGTVLSLAGLGAGYFWFYHWGPMRRVLDPAWYRQHSEAAHWKEFQACAVRTGWTHDGGSIVGKFGDKQWVQWIMDNARSDAELRGCDAGHKDGALRFLTNQNADESLGWPAWWGRNRLKSQEDWIREGFRNYDVALQTPLLPANIIALLKLAARPEDEKDGAPDYVQYNAFRWLRDSDFATNTFTVKDIPAKDADRVLQGLVRFARLSGQYPKGAGLGVLALGEPDIPLDLPPRISTRQFRILADTVVFVPLCTGLLLLWVSFHIGRRNRTLRENAQDGG